MASSLAAGPVLGQENAQQTAAARDLFAQGVELVAEEEWHEAADRFTRSLELRYSPVVAYNLASALVHLERLVQSSEHLQRVVRDEEAPQAARDAAAQLLREVEPRLGRLTIALMGDREGVEIGLDDRAIPGAVVGVAIPANPGMRTVVVRRGERIVAQGAVTVREGRRAELTLEVPPPPEPVVEEPEEPTDDPGSFQPGSALREELPEVAEDDPAGRVPNPGQVAQQAQQTQQAQNAQQQRVGSDGDGDSIWENPWFWTGVGAGVLVAAVAGTLVAIALLDEEAQGIPGNTEPPVVELGQ